MKGSSRMKKNAFAKIRVIITGSCLFLAFFLAPLMLYGQSAQAPGEAPPVGAQLVREGDFAAALEAALGVGTGRSEIEAENHLAEMAIMPRNGWIADYPVTPDILGELQEAIGNAADSGKLPVGRDEAIKRFGEVASDAGLLERSYANSEMYGPEPGSVEGYPDEGVVSGYYTDQGPPIVTYYAPPPDYYDLYSFVPYPFWYSTFWFPGFFVLRDFHRQYGHGFVSNHFVNATTNTFARVDPGTTSSGVSKAIVLRGRLASAGGPSFASVRAVAGAPGSAIRSFGAPRTMMLSSSRTFGSPRPSMTGGGVRAAPSFGGYHGSSIGGSSFSHAGGGFRGGGHGGGGHR